MNREIRDGVERLQQGSARQLMTTTEFLVAATRPDSYAQASPEERAAETAVHAIRKIIGEAVARFPPGEQRQAMKQILAPLLGNPLGQLLKGMEDRHVAACLEGHAELMALTMGATPVVNITVETTPSPSTSHLKVVQ